jgi:transposase
MLTDTQWAVLEPLIEAGRPKGKTPPRLAASEFSCVGRAVAPVQARARVKRSPKRMAN